MVLIPGRAFKQPSHQFLDRAPVLPGQPMRQLPEHYVIQFAVHGGGVIGELVEIAPASQAAVEAFHHVDLVHAIIAGQFVDQPGGEVSEFILGYGGHRAHGSFWPRFADDAGAPEK